MKIINRIIDAILVCVFTTGAGAVAFLAIDASIAWGSLVGFLFGVVVVVGWWLGKSGEES